MALDPGARAASSGGLFRWMLAGLVAGAAAGLIDGLWTIDRAAQFLPGVVPRLRLLGFLALAYAGLGAVVGASWGALAALAGRGPLARAMALLAAERATTRARDPRTALGTLALAIAAVPAVGGALALAHVLAVRELASRKHVGLVVAVAMAAALGALAAGALLAALLARPLEAALRRAARAGRVARALAAPNAPAIAAAALIALAAVAVAARTWSTLRLVDLRPWLAAAGLVALLPPAARATAGLAARAARRSLAARAALAATALAAVAALTCALGAPAPIQKATARGSGLGAPVARAYRAIVDLDRDGTSPLLGGGDCDDLDAAVHPGAAELPDDGVDNNCVGGDVALAAAHDPGFVARPPPVPVDLDVVLVTIDTLRADHVGAYGYRRPTTPTLDALAAEGALFVNAWAHAPSTRYSIPALLTGRLPLAVDYAAIPNQWPGLAERNTTIAELFAGRGYATGAVTNYWYFDKLRRMDQGFAHYDNANKKLHAAIAGEGPARTRGSSSRQQTDGAIAMFDRLGDGRRFLWVHYYDPHADHETPPGAATRFGATEIDRYDDEIRFTDEQLGRLFAELRRRGRWDRTAIVVTGDHGEGFGEHGIEMHGYHLYAAQTRVPLIIRVPGLPPSRPTVPAGHVDVLPTLANLIGAPPPPELDGVSLLDALAGGPERDRDRLVIQQLSYEGNHELRGAASQRCHVIYNVSPAASWEVYRLDDDPGEERDRALSPGPCAEVVDGLAAWIDRDQIPRDAAAALLAARPPIARPLDVDLGGEVRLLAVELPAAPVAPGAAVPVSFTFEARGPLSGAWRVFVHLERDGGGGGRFQADHAPARPFAWWRAGQTIRYTRTIDVPPSARPGTYRVWVGLYRERTDGGAARAGERRPASSRATRVVDDRAEVGALTIAPAKPALAPALAPAQLAAPVPP